MGGAALALVGGGVTATRLTMGSDADYERAMAAIRAPLGDEVIDLIRFATLAANGHNTQPWRFQVCDKRIRITPDVSRRTPVVDPDDHHMYASLGCAAENLALAAAAQGRPGELRFEPTGEGVIVFDHITGPKRPSALCDAIVNRQSTRAEFSGRTASAGDLDHILRTAQTTGVGIALMTDRTAMNRVRDLVIAGNSAQMADPEFMHELKDWMRFNPREAIAQRDGLYSACSGNPTMPNWIAGPVFDLAFRTEAENEKYAKHIASSGGVAVFIAEKNTREHWVAAGRACQRFALQATSLGMKLSFINQPAEVPALRAELASLAGMPGRRPNIVMRFGYGPILPMSPRRSTAAVIEL